MSLICAEMMRGGEDRCAEALELEAARDLRAEAEPQPTGPENGERREDGGGGGDVREQRWANNAPAVTPERIEQRDREQSGWEQLRCCGNAEQREARRLTICHERRDGGRHEQRRPVVEAVQRDRSERRGRDGGEAEGDVCAAIAHPKPSEDRRETRDRSGAAERLEDLEPHDKVRSG